VEVNGIEKSHPRSAKTLRKQNVDRVIRPENDVVYCFSKAKASAAYNQQATANIIAIVKDRKKPKTANVKPF